MSLTDQVDQETRKSLTPGYRKHAAWQSMASYLSDWRAAHALLEERIGELQRMTEERKTATDAGIWPASLEVES